MNRTFLYFLFLISAYTVEAKTIKYPNGDIYKGKVEEKLPEGLGTMTYADGSTYTGFWHKGKREGEGKYICNFLYSKSATLNGIWEADTVKSASVYVLFKDNWYSCMFSGVINGNNGHGIIEGSCSNMSSYRTNFADQTLKYYYKGDWNGIKPFKGIEYYENNKKQRIFQHYNNGSMNRRYLKLTRDVIIDSSALDEKDYINHNKTTLFSITNKWRVDGQVTNTDTYHDMSPDYTFTPERSNFPQLDEASIPYRISQILLYDCQRVEIRLTAKLSDSNVEQNLKFYSDEYDSVINKLIERERTYRARVALEKTLEEKTHNLQTYTYKNEEFRFGGRTYENGSYQYYLDNNGNQVKHGKFYATQTYREDMYGTHVVTGTYKHGRMDGKWSFSIKGNDKDNKGRKEPFYNIYELTFTNGFQEGPYLHNWLQTDNCHIITNGYCINFAPIRKGHYSLYRVYYRSRDEYYSTETESINYDDDGNWNGECVFGEQVKKAPLNEEKWIYSHGKYVSGTNERGTKLIENEYYTERAQKKNDDFKQSYHGKIFADSRFFRDDFLAKLIRNAYEENLKQNGLQ